MGTGTVVKGKGVCSGVRLHSGGLVIEEEFLRGVGGVGRCSFGDAMVTNSSGDRSRLEDIDNEVSALREVTSVERRPKPKNVTSELETLGKNLGDWGSRIFD